MFNERYQMKKAQDRHRRDRPRNSSNMNCFLEIPKHTLMYNLPRARSRSESFWFLPLKLAKCLAQELCQMHGAEPDHLRKEQLVNKPVRPVVTLVL